MKRQKRKKGARPKGYFQYAANWGQPVAAISQLWRGGHFKLEWQGTERESSDFRLALRTLDLLRPAELEEIEGSLRIVGRALSDPHIVLVNVNLHEAEFGKVRKALNGGIVGRSRTRQVAYRRRRHRDGIPVPQNAAFQVQ